MNILFTNAGRRTYIIENLLRSSKERNLDIEIHVCDTSLDNASFWVAPGIQHHLTPYVSEQPEEYVSLIKSICREHQIQMLIPLMDFELSLIAGIREELKEYGTTAVVSDQHIIDMCLDKNSMSKFCLAQDILTPAIYTSKEDVDYPVILKRALGSGSVGLKLAQNATDLLDYDPGRDLLQQFIQGQEYGLDIFNDLQGRFQYASFRKKIAMRSGETDKAEVFYDQGLWDYCEKLSKKIMHVGNMDADIIVNEEGEIFLIDLNPRFGGGYPFNWLAGVDGVGALLDLAFGKPVKYDFNRNKRYIACKGINIYGREVN